MGAAFARALVAEGAKVVIGDLLEQEGQAIAGELGPDAAFTPLDATDRDTWAQAVLMTVARFGKLNVLINDAGIARSGRLGEFSGGDWDATIATNLTGAFNGITAAVKSVADAAPSSVINISSTAGLVAYPAMSGYTAAKFGIRGLTKAAALDMGQIRDLLQFGPPRSSPHADDRRPQSAAGSRRLRASRTTGGAGATGRFPR
jgi:3alpha(or 20beta)-hydroxysteroid dehydrogenase